MHSPSEPLILHPHIRNVFSKSHRVKICCNGKIYIYIYILLVRFRQYLPLSNRSPPPRLNRTMIQPTHNNRGITNTPPCSLWNSNTSTLILPYSCNYSCEDNMCQVDDSNGTVNGHLGGRLPSETLQETTVFIVNNSHLSERKNEKRTLVKNRPF